MRKQQKIIKADILTFVYPSVFHREFAFSEQLELKPELWQEYHLKTSRALEFEYEWECFQFQESEMVVAVMRAVLR